MGNLTRDPELRVTPGGLSICKMGLAVSRQFTTQAGESREETAFVDVDAFGKQAEIISKYMQKGRPILIEGRLKLDQWENNAGEKRSKLSVVMESFQFVGSRSDNEGGSSSGNDDSYSGGRSSDYEQSSPPRRKSNPPRASEAPADDDFDDDVPF